MRRDGVLGKIPYEHPKLPRQRSAGKRPPFRGKPKNVCKDIYDGKVCSTDGLTHERVPADGVCHGGGGVNHSLQGGAGRLGKKGFCALQGGVGGRVLPGAMAGELLRAQRR